MKIAFKNEKNINRILKKYLFDCMNKFNENTFSSKNLKNFKKIENFKIVNDDENFDYIFLTLLSDEKLNQPLKGISNLTKLIKNYICNDSDFEHLNGKNGLLTLKYCIEYEDKFDKCKNITIPFELYENFSNLNYKVDLLESIIEQLVKNINISNISDVVYDEKLLKLIYDYNQFKYFNKNDLFKKVDE